MRANLVKLFRIWTNGGNAFKKYFLSVALAALLFSGAEPLCNFGRAYYEKLFCEIILNLGQWFRRRCRLKDFLSGAMAALLFGGAEPLMQF